MSKAMRTPEQIADQVLAEAGYADWYRPYQEQVRQDITAAIEADRAQRAKADDGTKGLQE